MWRRNAAGVDSVQAQGTVGCRAGIVEVDGTEIDGVRRQDGREYRDKDRKTHEAPVKLLRIR